MSVRVGAWDAPGQPFHALPGKLVADRVHLEIDSSFSSEGRWL